MTVITEICGLVWVVVVVVVVDVVVVVVVVGGPFPQSKTAVSDVSLVMDTFLGSSVLPSSQCEKEQLP